jgi:sterol desaturase/sphingolipid hydroxylase (fatty acid hydroxylase superfamily)
MAIRGFVAGSPFLATTGLSVLAVFVIVEVAVMRARNHPPGERMRQRAHGWNARFDTRRARHLQMFAFVLATVTWVVLCIVSAIAREWGGCLFYGVLASAGTGGVVVMWSERIEGEPNEAGADLPLTIDVR